MQAALAARRDPQLVIAGRTSAAGITGVDDAIRRVQAYQAAGVDAIFLVGVRSRADLEAIAASISLPIILGGAGKDMRDLTYLAQHRVRVCLQGHQPFMAAVQAVHETLAALRSGTAPEQLEGIADDALMRRVTRGEDYARWSKDWL
jgi:carboxyvinyl-carboxyphosphonate phosphorylmutase